MRELASFLPADGNKTTRAEVIDKIPTAGADYPQGRMMHCGPILVAERGCGQHSRAPQNESSPTGYNNPTNGPMMINSAVISTTQTALMTSPAGSISNIR